AAGDLHPGDGRHRLAPPRHRRRGRAGDLLRRRRPLPARRPLRRRAAGARVSLRVAGARFSVVGAGRSGVAAANVLATRGGDVVLLEARPDAPRPDALHAAVDFRPGTNAVRRGDVAVLSPGIPEVSPVRTDIAARASDVLGEIEL